MYSRNTNLTYVAPQMKVNQFVYVNNATTGKPPSKILFNPHFKKTVFINPNFPSSSAPQKIHINPNVTSLKINQNKQQIFVNPTVLRTQPVPEAPPPPIQHSSNQHLTVVSTRMKLIRATQHCKPRTNKSLRKPLINVGKSKFKLVRAIQSVNQFKVDNKLNISISSKRVKAGRKAYVYINRFVTFKDAAKNAILKKSVTLRNSTSSSNPSLYRKTNKLLTKSSRYKLVRKNSKTVPNRSKVVSSKSVVKRFKVVRVNRSHVQRTNLKKCNTPCTVYRRFGKCKGRKNGTCIKKHDPDQIILCVKFLQGACVKENCPLSHKVSPEKMPTCKYYLEGQCSKDDCPYLHVKINPKAAICRDFLEGFCKQAAQCDKRHQMLCPEFDKNGSCPKRNCPYPHGSRVRNTNSVFSKFLSRPNKQAKSSVPETIVKEQIANDLTPDNVEKNVSNRYYIDCNEEQSNQLNSDKTYVARPKLGELPSFIPLDR